MIQTITFSWIGNSKNPFDLEEKLNSILDRLNGLLMFEKPYNISADAEAIDLCSLLRPNFVQGVVVLNKPAMWSEPHALQFSDDTDTLRIDFSNEMNTFKTEDIAVRLPCKNWKLGDWKPVFLQLQEKMVFRIWCLKRQRAGLPCVTSSEISELDSIYDNQQRIDFMFRDMAHFKEQLK